MRTNAPKETAWAKAHPDMERPLSNGIFSVFLHTFSRGLGAGGFDDASV
jgi:hypothetical protein